MPDTYICVKCGKVAKTRQALERHAAYHEDDRPFSCEVCLQRFKNSDDRGKHYRRLRRDGKFNTACTVCHKHFRTDEMLIKHMEMLGCKSTSEVTVKQELDDNEAGNNIGNDNGAGTVAVEHNPGDGINCTCKICEMEFSNTSCLKVHYKDTHNDIKKQICIQCGQTLSSKDSLARHFSIFHQTSFPYACDVCNQKFKIKESLCRHVKFVHQDGGYTCPECQRVFSQPVNLKKHMAVHTLRKEYACKFCGREFRWKQALQKHELLHDLQDDDIETSKKCNDDNDVNKSESDLLLVNVENADSDTTETYDDDDMTCNGIGSTSTLMDEIVEKHGMEKSLNNMGQTFDTTVHEDDNLLNNSNRDSTNTLKNTKGINVDIRHEQTYEGVSSDTIYNEFELSDDDVGDRVSSTSNSCQEKGFAEQVLERKRAGGPLHLHGHHGHSEKKIKLVNEKMLENGASSVRHESKATFPTLLLLNETKSEMLDAKNTDDIEDSPPLEKSAADKEDNENGFAQYQIGQKYDAITHIDSDESRHSDESSDHLDNECQKLRYSSLTSFPTKKTQYAPKLVFKPSSIQNILTGPPVSPIHASVAMEEKEIDNIHCNRRANFKFPATSVPIHKRLHNPFIMHSSSVSAVRNETNLKRKNSSNLFEVQKEVPCTPSLTPMCHVVPAGKFSLLKHMLSLQNEENFDKTIFENPLYHKPADVKDFELMVERHRVTDKSSMIDTYDLSAKQNIPFHWLGMSIAKKNLDKTADKINKDMLESEKSNDTVSVEINENYEGNGKSIGTKIAEKCSSTGVQYKCVNDYNSEKIDHFDNTQQLTPRRYQTLKSLSATTSGIGAQSETSVFANPFDYQNMDFQEKESAVKIKSFDNTRELFGRSHTTVQSYKLITQEQTVDDHRFCNLSKIVDIDTIGQCETVDSRLNVKASEHVPPSVMPLSPPTYINGHTVPTLELGLSNTSPQVASSHQLTGTFALSSVADATWSQDALSLSRSLSESLNTLAPVTTSSRYLSRNLSIPSSCSYSKVTAQRIPPRRGPIIRTENDTDHPMNVSHRNKSNDSIEPILLTSSENNVISPNMLENMDTNSENVYVNSNRNIEMKKHFDLMMINKNIAQLQRIREDRFGRIDRTNYSSNMRKCAATIDTSEDTNTTKTYFTENMTPSVRLFSRIDNGEYDSVCAPPNKFCQTILNSDVQFHEESQFDAYTLIDSPGNSNPAQVPATVAVRQAAGMPEARTKMIDVFDHALESSEGNICQCSHKKCIASGCIAGENKVGRMNVLENRSTSTMGRHTSRCIVREETKRTEVSIFDILKSSGSDEGKDFESFDCLLDTYM